jgi:hypothetical protein
MIKQKKNSGENARDSENSRANVEPDNVCVRAVKGRLDVENK